MILLDTTPIILLAAVVAWVSLITMEFYEKIYRPRIEANFDKLKKLGEGQLNVLLQEIELKLRKGQADINILEKKAQPVVSLLNAEEEFIKSRNGIFFSLFVLSIISVAASYAPDFIILSTPLTLAAIAYIVSGAVFFWGYLMLRKMFWFDKQFLAIARAEKESAPKEKTSVESKKGVV